MPATEQTWREQKLMHRVFAVSSVILLGSTIWMFLADHQREWKQYQRNFRDVEMQVTSWRELQFLTDQAVEQGEQLSSALLRSQSKPIDPAMVEQFIAAVHDDEERRGSSPGNYDYLLEQNEELQQLAEEASDKRETANAAAARAEQAEVDALAARVKAEQATKEAANLAPTSELAMTAVAEREAADQAVQEAERLSLEADAAQQEAEQAERAAAQAHDDLIASLQQLVDAARDREDQALGTRKFKSADVDAAKANKGLNVRDHRPVETLEESQAVIDQLVEGSTDSLTALTLTYEALNEHRKELQSILGQMNEEVSRLEKQHADNRSALERLKQSNVERRSTFFTSEFPYLGKRLLELPILDAFSSPLTIDNLWDDDNKIDYNFSKVRRFDRCTTCHRAIAQTMPGTATEPAYIHESFIDFVIDTPPEAELPDSLDLEQIYGIRLAEEGEYMLNRDDATISFVQPFTRGVARTPARILVAHSMSNSNGTTTELFPLQQDLSLRITGPLGTKLFARAKDVDPVPPEQADQAPRFSAGESAAQVAATINAETETTGVEAEVTAEGLELRTTKRGSLAFIRLEDIEDGSGQFEAHASQLGAKGTSAPAALGAQAIRAPNGEQTQQMPGQELRLDALQPTAIVDAQDDPAISLPGLLVGDVIVKVNDDVVRNRAHALQLLLTGRGRADWGKPLRLQIRRGLPHPYTSHPRLDLFLSDASPHPMRGTKRTFACTICHEGQGSATAFKYASHTPNTPIEQDQWQSEHGWFNNPHWIFPMYPKRFAESGCLKCHHDVTELEASEKFPEAPAPKAVHGHTLIRKYGCFGCHEINGYDGPDRRVGPDMRLEPNFFAVALELKSQLRKRRQQLQENAGTDGESVQDALQEIDAAEALADQLVEHPGADAVRRELRELILLDAVDDLDEHGAALSGASHALAENLADVETPGTLRRVGPSLRFVDHKLDLDFMVDWIGNPQNFRSQSRMPRFFGMSNHLNETTWHVARTAAEQIALLATDTTIQQQASEVAQHPEDAALRSTLRAEVLTYVARRQSDQPAAQSTNESDQPADVAEQQAQLEQLTQLANELVDLGERFEPLEILGIASYLQNKSQHFEYIEPDSEGITESSREDQVLRGESIFRTRCLACHSHEDYPEIEEFRPVNELVQGPDLSRIGDKFTGEKGRSWLYTWIKQPTKYHARTFMPDLFLGRQEHRDTEGNVTMVTDQVDDLVQFLLEKSTTGWSPADSNLTRAKLDTDEVAQQTLDELVLANLKDTFPTRRSEEFLREGIPEDRAPDLKGAELELLGETDIDKKLMYVGSKAINKYGCFGCHDISGFESAKPIGTGLADWGRKDPSKLAFNHITSYLEHHGGGHGNGGHGQSAHGVGTSHEDHSAHDHDSEDSGHAHSPAAGDVREQNGDAEQSFTEQDEGFYVHALEAGHRAGFIYQKLREPRSYDYHDVDNKKYNERLRMPQFPLDDVEREAVITFVLGLVADPPASKFVYRAGPREKALAQGRQVLTKFNCGGCHILDTQEWDIRFSPGAVTAAPVNPTFPFVTADFDPVTLAASSTPNRQAKLDAHIVGMPAISTTDALPEITGGEYEDPLEQFPEDLFDPQSLTYSFELYEPVALDGNTLQVGQSLSVQADMIQRRYPTKGGVLAKYLLPYILEMEKKNNPGVAPKGKQAWESVPPPLVGEGSKVRGDWLHDFLLDPHEIRPKAVLRMPRFNMSDDEAAKLVNYFAAKDNANYPYEFNERIRGDHLAAAEAEYQQLLEDSEGQELSEGGRFDHAMKIILNKKEGCAQCHIIGDYSEAPQGPDLRMAYRRLRPDYVQRWVARPSGILPYTSMPENVKYTPDNPETDGFVVKYMAGSSQQQLNGLVDLLMNFDRYWLSKNSFAELVEASAPAEEEEDEAATASSGAGAE